MVLSYCQNLANRRDCIGLDWVPCRFGGRRAWFICPVCGRRCGSLFIGDEGFACRSCGGLTYWTTRDDPFYRDLRRADRVRERLGWGKGVARPEGGRPKGMHRKTFERLRTAYREHTWAYWDRMDARTDRLRAANIC